MDKAHATKLLGGTPTSAAAAIGISYQAYRQWPEVLTRKLEDRVIAAVARQNPKIQRLLSPKETANV